MPAEPGTCLECKLFHIRGQVVWLYGHTPSHAQLPVPSSTSKIIGEPGNTIILSHACSDVFGSAPVGFTTKKGSIANPKHWVPKFGAVESADLPLFAP